MRVQAKKGRIGMIDYFDKQMQAMLPQLHDQSFIERNAKLFELEAMQFHKNLPVYARKEEFLRYLQSSQCLVLKGGTGIGKPVGTVIHPVSDTMISCLSRLHLFHHVGSAEATLLCQLQSLPAFTPEDINFHYFPSAVSRCCRCHYVSLL